MFSSVIYPAISKYRLAINTVFTKTFPLSFEFKSYFSTQKLNIGGKMIFLIFGDDIIRIRISRGEDRKIGRKLRDSLSAKLS